MRRIMKTEIFKAYDVRGIYPSEIDENIFKNIARAYATWLKPKKVALGRDVRTSGRSLWKAFAEGLTEMGVDVVDIGVISTDMLYFAVGHYGFDGGVTITASHNPAEYNGLKFVREGAKPISMESGIAEIRDLTIKGKYDVPESKGAVEQLQIIDDYIKEVLSFVKIEDIKPLKVVVNPNFGAAGVAIDKIAENLGVELEKINFEPNGSFPKGRPDPIIPENRKETSELVLSSGADFGVAWDADADRCFFFNEKGEFVDGYYETALLAQIVLEKYPKSKIIHDPRLIWAIIDLVKEVGGIPIKNKVGHSFIKARMREEEAVFGGENSGHFYFKDFYYSDNGIIPFLLVLEKLSKTGKKLSELVDYIQERYPNSGEINFKVEDKGAMLRRIEELYYDGEIDHIDGVSVTYPDWRFNVRVSNTEPLLRLTLEAKTERLVAEKVQELKNIIEK